MRKKGILKIIGFLGIIVVLALFFIGFLGRPVSTDNTTKIVTIEEGSGSSKIADQLKDEKLIKSSLVFKINSKISGDDKKFMAGSYELAPSMSAKEIMKKIASGDTAGQTFQIIEGMTIDKVANQLSESGIIDKDEFYNEIKNGKFDYKFMKYLPEGAARLEGFLYPNTYKVKPGASSHEVIDMMLSSFNDNITDKYYEEAKKQGKDIYEVVTTASIIEREASMKDEKPKVSSVIKNRLKIDMPLQMDSIISYIQKEDKIRATYEDIAIDSAYNPYTNKGLPPGPISSPGKDAIEAALYPADTEYIYFVASPKLDGTNVYAKTYKEFLKDKEAFDKAYEKYIKENPGEK